MSYGDPYTSSSLRRLWRSNGGRGGAVISKEMRALVGQTVQVEGERYRVERFGYQRRTSGGPTHPVAYLLREGTGSGRNRKIGAERLMRLLAQEGGAA